jgi:hypothetical protein
MLINSYNHRPVMNKYYVYVFLRKDRYTPYYVGKGSRDRDTSLCRTTHKPKDRERIVRVKEGLTEEDAFQLERTLIKFWGRKDQGGILYNLTDGGEGVSGHKHTEETKRKISKGLEKRPVSAKTRNKTSQTLRGHKVATKSRRIMSEKTSKRFRDNKYMWVNNGTKETMICGDIPEGYIRGRLG